MKIFLLLLFSCVLFSSTFSIVHAQYIGYDGFPPHNDPSPYIGLSPSPQTNDVSDKKIGTILLDDSQVDIGIIKVTVMDSDVNLYPTIAQKVPDVFHCSHFLVLFLLRYQITWVCHLPLVIDGKIRKIAHR